MTNINSNFNGQSNKTLSLAQFHDAAEKLERRSAQFYPRFKALLRRLPRHQRLEACLTTYENIKGSYPHYGILLQAVIALRHAKINDKSAVLRKLEFYAPFETKFKDALTRRVNAIG